MYRRFLLVLLFLAVLASCTATADAPEASAPPAPPVVPAADPAQDYPSPEAVTESFYNWYLDTIGPRDGGDFINPLVEGLYRDRAELTSDYIAQLDDIVAGFENGGYDPILQAQDIPEAISVQEASIAGDSATVILLRRWGGNPEPSPLTVHLLLEDGIWRIDNVTAFEIPVAEPLVEPEAPDTVARAFYEWYLGYIGEPGSDTFRNPMVDGAYRDTPYLTDSFVGHVDELLAGWREQEMPGYDPFLCAQDIPTELVPVVTFERNGMAGVVMRSSFPNQRFTVELWPDGAGWRIGNIVCASDPAGTAHTFYTWYLGYIGNRDGGDFRNPLVDQAYQEMPLLSASLVAEVDALLDSFENGGCDPFLLAQDIPADFTADPGVVENSAVVHLLFGGSVRHLLVRMDETGRRIAAISEDEGLPSAAPADVAGELFDEARFSIRIPAGWQLEPLAPAAGGPEDWPVTDSWLLFPEAIAAQVLAAGPPDPEAPVIVAPFNIEWVAGDEAALARVYGDLDGEKAEINGLEVLILQEEPGITHFIFAHPDEAESWLVLTDWVTEFPGREAQAETAAPQWEPLLYSVEFN